MEPFYKSTNIHELSDYCKGIMYASGCITSEGNVNRIAVRNLDNGMPSALEKKSAALHIHLCTTSNVMGLHNGQ